MYRLLCTIIRDKKAFLNSCGRRISAIYEQEVISNVRRDTPKKAPLLTSGKYLLNLAKAAKRLSHDP